MEQLFAGPRVSRTFLQINYLSSAILTFFPLSQGISVLITQVPIISSVHLAVCNGFSNSEGSLHGPSPCGDLEPKDLSSCPLCVRGVRNVWL
jgi:hypothetical protein